MSAPPALPCWHCVLGGLWWELPSGLMTRLCRRCAVEVQPLKREWTLLGG